MVKASPSFRFVRMGRAVYATIGHYRTQYYGSPKLQCLGKAVRLDLKVMGGYGTLVHVGSIGFLESKLLLSSGNHESCAVDLSNEDERHAHDVIVTSGIRMQWL